MKLGVLLPTFRDGAEDALAFAGEAVDAGVDGVFAYDHLWPMGSPTRPSLAPFPLLAAVARRTRPSSSAHSWRAWGWWDVAPGRGVHDARARGSRSGHRGSRIGRQTLGRRERGLRHTEAKRRRTTGADGRDGARARGDRMPVWFGAGNDDDQSRGSRGRRDDQPLGRDAATACARWRGRARCSGPDRVAGGSGGDLDALRDAGATWAVFAPDVDIEVLRRGATEHDE